MRFRKLVQKNRDLQGLMCEYLLLLEGNICLYFHIDLCDRTRNPSVEYKSEQNEVKS
jgi:hypothetical protein